MVGQGHLADQSKFIGRNYLSFIDGVTTLNINYYETNISLLKCMTVCIESCETGDISSSVSNCVRINNKPGPPSWLGVPFMFCFICQKKVLKSLY